MDVMVIVVILSLSLATAMAGAFGGMRVVLFLIARTRALPGPPRSSAAAHRISS